MAATAMLEAPPDGAAHLARPPLRAVRAHYCSAAQAAAELALSDRRVRWLAAHGLLEAEIVEGRWMVSRAAVAALREERATAQGHLRRTRYRPHTGSREADRTDGQRS